MAHHATTNVSRNIATLEAAMTALIGGTDFPEHPIWHASIGQDGVTIVTETVKMALDLGLAFAKRGCPTDVRKYGIQVYPSATPTGGGVPLIIEAEGRPALK